MQRESGKGKTCREYSPSQLVNRLHPGRNIQCGANKPLRDSVDGVTSRTLGRRAFHNLGSVDI
jgi:hypothetical protein